MSNILWQMPTKTVPASTAVSYPSATEWFNIEEIEHLTIFAKHQAGAVTRVMQLTFADKSGGIIGVLPDITLAAGTVLQLVVLGRLTIADLTRLIVASANHYYDSFTLPAKMRIGFTNVGAVATDVSVVGRG